ncbi:small multi-drug export protein [Candidatus Woesearchaeota archaeon]|nr:small multi-drug export protein [Candidatus Woesearchaeota archaeon]
MNNFLLWGIILSMLPISEVRGGIPVGLQSSLSPVLIFFILSFFNILIVPLVFLFLDYLHVHFMRINFYNKLFNKYINRIQRKFEQKLGFWSYVALFFFVFIPAPTTGAYTGALIAWFFKMNKFYSFIAIALGVLGASLIVTLVSLGLFKIF